MPNPIGSDDAAVEAAVRDLESPGPDPDLRYGNDSAFDEWVATRVAALQALGRLSGPRALDVLTRFVQGLRPTSSESSGFDRVGAAGVRALSDHRSADRAAAVLADQLVKVCQEEERRRGEIEKSRQRASLFTAGADQERALKADVAREHRRQVEPLEQARQHLVDCLVRLGPVARPRLEAVASREGGLAKASAAKALEVLDIDAI